MNCLKCQHDYSQHTIEMLGYYDGVEITCKAVADHDGYEGNCGCDAGFKKVAIKKEFTQMG